MAAVSRHWPEELGGGKVRGEWGRACGRLGVSGEGQKPGEWRERRERSRRYKAQGGKEGRSERSCKEGLRNTEEGGKESAHPCLCLKAKPPLPPDQEPFLTGLPSNSPAQLRSDEEGGNLSSSSLGPDQKRPNILAPSPAHK